VKIGGEEREKRESNQSTLEALWEMRRWVSLRTHRGARGSDDGFFRTHRDPISR